jgi:CCR4-NOT transcriptional complex subunit CAF120
MFVTDGRPCADRQWVECYAQLVGTALSLWDAAALDAAGEEAEVPPTFINLADASIKVVRNSGYSVKLPWLRLSD